MPTSRIRHRCHAYSCDTSRNPCRDASGNVFEIVHAGVLDGDPAGRPPPLRPILSFPGQHLPGNGIRVKQLPIRARKYHRTSGGPCTGPHVDNPVRCPHYLLVVLHNEKAVSLIAKPVEHFDELADVPLVEPHSGLVENVEHVDKVAAQLARHFDALRFSAAEAACSPV